MAERKVPKKEIANDARQLLKQGTSKQQTFETLVDKYKYGKDVADVLKNIPSLIRIQKYGAWNFLLLFLLILIVLISLFLTGPSFIVLYYGLLIYAVAMKQVKFYMWISLLSTCALIGFVAIILTTENAKLNWPALIAILGLTIPTFILPLWLEKKLCPKPIERKEQYTNSNGEQRMRIVYYFNEPTT